MTKIAALYVIPGGPYYGLADVEPWGLPERDARLYAGPWPVVAHPPCARWGHFWYGSPSGTKRFKLGDDDGCFAAALAAVERFGGVLEHPAATHAWKAFGIAQPARVGGWTSTRKGWTCCVDQGHYGHRAQKATWLYVVGPKPPSFIWGQSEPTDRRGHDAKISGAGTKGAVHFMSKRERAATPVPFRDLLLAIAAACRTGC